MKKRFLLATLILACQLVSGEPAACGRHNTGWSFSEAFVYWYGKEQGVGYTNGPANILTTSDFTERSAINPSFDWEPGLRLGSRYTERDTEWTFQSFWTYVRSKASGERSVNSGSPNFQGMFPIWSMGPGTLPGDYVSSASSTWHLYTNLFDLFAQYNLTYGPFKIMPFAGARAAFLSQKLKARYTGGTFFSGTDLNKLKSHYYAGGPRVGINIDCALGFGLSFFTDLGISPLFGHLHKSQSETYLGMSRFYRFANGFHFVLSNDYQVGFRWKGTAIKDRLWATLGIAWEGQEFFYADSFYRGPFDFFPRHRHLYLHGLTFTAALDF